MSNASRSIEAEPLPKVDLARDAILLDVDGTLLDIARTPSDVHVPPTLRETLERLFVVTDGGLALISGRRLAEVDALFEPLRLAAIGCHGAELRPSPGLPDERRGKPLPSALKQALSDVAIREPRIRMEDKVYTLAFHYRGAPEREDALLHMVRERIKPFAADFVLLRGKAIVEVKAKGFNKGEAFRTLMGFAPFSARRPIFFGDDTTDEDVFAVLPEFGGLGISVGRRVPLTNFMVHSPRDVRRWLAELVARDDGDA